ncbi:hypothetical protein H7I94_18580, partial [Mycobacterium szulgai]|nr:hypothetical protein [Mycobacterium szulgai]
MRRSPVVQRRRREEGDAVGSTVLVQPVHSAGLRAAQRGQTGVTSDTDYLGN